MQILPSLSSVGYLEVSQYYKRSPFFNFNDQFAALNACWKTKLTLISENYLLHFEL